MEIKSYSQYLHIGHNRISINKIKWYSKNNEMDISVIGVAGGFAFEVLNTWYPEKFNPEVHLGHLLFKNSFKFEPIDLKNIKLAPYNKNFEL